MKPCICRKCGSAYFYDGENYRNNYTQKTEMYCSIQCIIDAQQQEPININDYSGQNLMKYEIFIPKRLDGLNEIINAAKQIYGRGKRRPSAYSLMKKNWTAKLYRYFRAANIDPMESIYIEFIWIEKNRRRDPDNIAVGKKFILDAMVAVGIIENDGWKQILKMTDKFAVSKETPGVIVKIQDANAENTEKEKPIRCNNCDKNTEKNPVYFGDEIAYYENVCRNCGNKF